jgi:hypothetical protein
LLTRYAIAHDGDVDYDNTSYRPRAWKVGATVPDLTWGTGTVTNAGPYAGYDLWYGPNASGIRANGNADWLTVTLNRPGRLVVVWRNGGNFPACFSNWTAGADVVVSGDTYRTKTKDVPAGDVTLCGPTAGIGGVHDLYWVLLAEKGGAPSADPRPGVLPNQVCPSGYFNETDWHPSIDPVTWCYAGHEHGVNPAVCDPSWSPHLTTAATAMGMTEAHPGFKVMAWVGSDGTCWSVTIHQGTGGTGRLCLRHHTVGLAIWDRPGGTKLADIQFMADFGKAIDNETKALIGPTACTPDPPGNGFGNRQISTIATGGIGYEPWTLDSSHTVFGLSGDFNLNTFDVVTKCDVVSPCTLVPTGDSGSKHQFQGAFFGFDGSGPSGSFCTDPMGMKVVACGTVGAISQYIAPGLSIQVGHNKIIDYYGWGLPGVPTESDLLNWNPTEREDSIQGAN